MATRREFLAGAAALGVSAACGAARAAEPAPVLVSAGQSGGRPSGLVWRASGLEQSPLPGRGHASVRLASDRALIVGRRPGAFCAVLAVAQAKVQASFPPTQAARFCGHAAVSPDGRTLVTAELDAESIEGRIGVRDPASGQVRAVWDPGGMEPHEVGFTPDGSRLIVALGGLRRDGGVAGPAVSPDEVRSALVELDPLSGRVLKRHELGPAHRSLSMRHLAFSPDGRRMAVAMQDQDPLQRRPLVGVLEPGGEVELLPMPDPAEVDFRGYVGSTAMDLAGDYLAASSPRGSVVGLWSMAEGRFLGAQHIGDVCGLASGARAGEFWATSGYGDVVRLQASAAGFTVLERSQAAAGFEHHLLRL